MALTKFWSEVSLEELSNDTQLIYIIFKVKFNDGSTASISNLQKVNKTQLQEVLETFLRCLDSKSENYSDKIYKEIIFTYHVLNDVENAKKTSRISNKYETRKINKFNFSGYNFPVTTDYSKWGLIVKEESNFILIKKFSSILPYFYEITLHGDKQEVKVMDGNKVLYQFIDYFGENSISFTRKIGLDEYLFKNGELLLKQKSRKVSFFESLKTDKKMTNKFITLDIETRTIDNVFIPYCISYFDGKKTFSFYLNDFKDSDDMLTTCITNLLQRKYNGYKVYVHNLSNFDGIFLLRILSNVPGFNLLPTMKDGKLINLNLSKLISNKKYQIDFRDSLLMLPLSLRRLCKAFNVDLASSKSIFPYDFINLSDTSYDYAGIVPDYEYFSRVDKSDYDIYKNKYITWNLKKETIKYCELDCISLYKVLESFNELIYNKYKLNIHRFPTLPSLAFSIYKTHFMIEKLIPRIGAEIYGFIRAGYTGGHTDVYKPYAENVYAYDVNSLYPSVMRNNDMPVGTPKYFEFSESISISDFLKHFNNPFGFFEVDVETPDTNRPLFQTKVQTAGGYRTVAPLGSWTDVIFSEEMFKYLEFGYKFKITRGYLFEKKNIFKDYIDDLYKIKQNHSKDHPMYLISKLLMNSLYGRFGMSDNLNNHLIVNNDDLNDTIAKLSGVNADISESVDLTNGKTLLTIVFESSNSTTLIKQDISIPIASAVTAYSRIYMSDFLSDTNLDVLYTDTDSIYTTTPLADNLINNELGGWKLEETFSEAVFLAPKVYGGVLRNGKEITKVKGFKNSVAFNQLVSLLIKDNKVKLYQDKWYKSIVDGNIHIENSVYTLIATDNKRELIYDDNRFVSTKLFKIDHAKKGGNKI